MSDLLQPTLETSAAEQAPLGRATPPARRLWLAAILAAIVVASVLISVGNQNPAEVHVINDTRTEAILDHRADLWQSIPDTRAEAIMDHRADLWQSIPDTRAEAIMDHRADVWQSMPDTRAEALAEHQEGSNR